MIWNLFGKRGPEANKNPQPEKPLPSKRFVDGIVPDNKPQPEPKQVSEQDAHKRGYAYDRGMGEKHSASVMDPETEKQFPVNEIIGVDGTTYVEQQEQDQKRVQEVKELVMNDADNAPQEENPAENTAENSEQAKRAA